MTSGWWQAFAEPRSLAVVGPRPGSRNLAWLAAQRWQGTVVGVHPRRDEIDGVPCVRRLTDTTEVDAALVLTPGEHVAGILRDAVDAGIRAVTVYAAEITGDGVEADRRLVASLIAGSDTRVIGPNALGVLNMAAGVTSGFSSSLPLLTAEPERQRAGRVAIVAQSGGLGDAIMVQLLDRDVGIHSLTQTGNESDVSAVDVIDVLGDDRNVDVIACYLEGVRRPNHLAQALAKATRAGKRIVMLKVGGTERGRAAALTHTGAITGDDATFDVLCSGLGITRVIGVAELVDTVQVLAAWSSMPSQGGHRDGGARIALISASGGTLTLLSEASERAGIDLAELAPETTAAITVVNPLTDGGMPLDLTGYALANPDVLKDNVAAVAADPGVDAIVYGIGLAAGAAVAEATTAALAAAHDAGVPSLALLIASAVRDRAYGKLRDHGVPMITEDPQRGFDAVAAWARGPERADVVARLLDGGSNTVVTCCPEPANGTEHTTTGSSSATWSEHRCRTWLTHHDIPVVPGGVADDIDDAVAIAEEVGWPVVAKIDSPLLPHRTEHGAVIVDVADATSLRAAVVRLTSAAGDAGLADDDWSIMVTRYMPGVEVLVSVRATDYGPMVSVGSGGVLAELVGDVATAWCPVSPTQAEEMITRLKVATLLEDFRGRGPMDRDALIAAIVALSTAAVSHAHEIDEFEINPMIVRTANQGAWAADALATLRMPTPDEKATR